MRINPVTFLFLIVFVSLISYSEVHAEATTTYTFNADTVGTIPAGVTPTIGDFSVVNNATLGNALYANPTGTTTNNWSASFTNFASSSDYSVTWKEAFVSGGGRHGFILRSQGQDSSVPGLKQGYLFQVNHTANGNTARIYSLTSGSLVLLRSTSLVSVSPRWFKAVVTDNTQALYYSNDGITYSIAVATTTDSTYASGGVQYSAGYGQITGNDFVDDVVQTLPDISSVYVATSSSQARITWNSITPSNSQIEYGTTSTYTSSSTIDTDFKNSHSVMLSGLTPSTTYHYRIKNVDAQNNIIFSSNRTFVTSTSSNSITLTSPKSYQVFQRNGSNLANILISGRYTGSPTAIEASWNNGPYTVVATPEFGGSFTGYLMNQLGGQGTLSVRFTNDTSVSTSSAYVGVGDVFLIAGQSNASGRGFTNQTYSHPTLKATMYGNDYQWKELTDPTDSNIGQLDTVSSDSATGSLWPLVATKYMAKENVPVAFIPNAKGGTSINSWERSSLSTAQLYGSMYNHTKSAGSIKAVLFFQGETDVNENRSRAEYSSKLNSFINNIYTDFGVKTVVGQIGNGAYSSSSIDAIRAGQIDVWNSNPYAIGGPAFLDVNLADESGDNLHFKSNNDLLVFADRFWAAMDAGFYGGADGRGPQVSTIYWGSNNKEIVITFKDETLPLIASTTITGFSVNDAYGNVPITSAQLIAENKIKLTLSRNGENDALVTHGSNAIGVGGQLITDSSALHLPAEMFINVPVLFEPVIPVPRTTTVTGYGGSSSYVSPVHEATPTLPTIPQTPASFTFTKSLSSGMTSPEVKTLQQYLNAKGFTVSKTGAGSPGKETNFFGSATRAALIKFQKANKISPAVGFFGPMTRGFILSK